MRFRRRAGVRDARRLPGPRLPLRDETDMTLVPTPTRSNPLLPPLRGLGALALAALLAACGSVSMPMGSADVDTPLDLTGSIDGQQNTADLDIGQDDRRAIAQAIAEARAAGAGKEGTVPPLAWTNPTSGNSGTILALKDDSIAGGTGCTRFETSANTIGGVRAYQGLACRDLMQDWQIVRLSEKPAEAAAAAGPASGT